MASGEEMNFRIQKLNSDNYAEWKFDMEMLLMAKDVWDIVSGVETLDDDASNDVKAKFKKRDNFARSVICLSVSSSNKIYVRNAKTSKETWDALANHFEEKTVSRKVMLRRKLYSMRMEGKSAADHINTLRTVNDNLQSLGDALLEKDLVMILLSSLPEEYNNLITTLETLKDEQLTWEYVRDRVLAEFERRKGFEQQSKVRNENSNALFCGGAGSSSNSNSNWRNNNGGDNRNPKQSGKSNIKCHYCKKKGHVKKECPKFKADREKREKESGNFCSAADASASVDKVCENFAFEFALHVDDADRQVCDEKWWLDSACSRHMTGVKSDLVDYREFTEDDPKHDVVLADKTIVRGAGEGDLRVILTDENGEKVPVLLRNVLFVPQLKKRLMSIGQLTKLGAEVTFSDQEVTLRVHGRTFVFGGRFGKLYELTCEVLPSSCNFGAVDETSLTTWHLRFGHLNKQDVQKLVSKNLVEGMSISDAKSTSLPENCDGCILGKQSRSPFPKSSQSKTTSVLELVHSDVCGPMSVASVGGSFYFVSFIDDYSRYAWVYIIKKKGEAIEKFKQFIALSENVTGKRIKRFRSDNGGEYFSGEFDKICSERGIFREPTIPYTPQQNGVAERYNRTIMDNVRALLYHANLPLSLWGEAVSTVVYLRNRSPTSSLDVTPYEKLFQAKPHVGHLRVFGCCVYVKIPDEKRQKLDAKAQKGVFVGYPEGSKGNKIFLPNSGKMIRSRDVKFLEHQFPTEVRNPDQPAELLFEPQYFCQPPAQSNNDEFITCPLVSNDTDADIDQDDRGVDLRSSLQDLARPMRIRREPDRYGEWAAAAEAVNPDPKTYKQAMRSEDSERWKEAMTEEYNSLSKHNTWDLVDLPAGKNLVGSKWVYKTKLNSFGEIDRFKARLVAQGYSQEYGIDFNEVFAPVARYKSIRSLLAVSNQHNLEVHQMDVVSAFLNGKLEEEIYMQQPEGFVDQKNPGKVCRLNTSLYGLKQSARCWNQLMDSYLKSQNYEQSTADLCVYYKTEIVDGEKVFILIGVYVDDTILCCNNLKYLVSEKEKISSKFEMDDRGEVNFILGMTVKRDRENRTLTISQKTYLSDVLQRFNMSDCKPVSTPVEPGQKFEKRNDDEDQFDVSTYQSAIGSLNYAAIATRPDISLAVGKLSQFMQSPSQTHWIAVKRIMRYIKGTIDYGLKFTYSDEFKLYGYSDSDWAGCVMSRKSTSGHVFRIGGCTVSWRSKKQSIVALSSTEAEYVALCEAAQETTWLRHLLHDIGLRQVEPTTVFEDNQGSIALSRNPKDHPRTKHVDVKYHFIRNAIERKRLSVVYCPTGDMVADTLTKGLPRPSFEKFRLGMGVGLCQG